MKKISSIIIACSWICISAFTQTHDSTSQASKRNYFYTVKIENTDGKSTNTVLSRFGADTVFVIDFDKTFNVLSKTSFKIIHDKTELGIAVSDIKTIKIIKDKHIVLAEDFKKERTKAILLGSGSSGSEIPTNAFEGMIYGIINIGAAIGILATSKIGKKITLNGEKEKYEQMLSKVAPKVNKKNNTTRDNTNEVH